MRMAISPLLAMRTFPSTLILLKWFVEIVLTAAIGTRGVSPLNTMVNLPNIVVLSEKSKRNRLINPVIASGWGMVFFYDSQNSGLST